MTEGGGDRWWRAEWTAAQTTNKVVVVDLYHGGIYTGSETFYFC